MAAINLYPLLVEGVFGGLLMAGIGLVIIFAIIGMIARMSQFLILAIIFCFILAYGIGYVGALIAIPAFIFAAMYFVLAVYHLWQTTR